MSDSEGAIPEPFNPEAFNPQPSMPEHAMYEASWQHSQIEQLFEDLQGGAKVEHVQVRTSNPGADSDRAVTLEEASQLFRDGEATAIQIRYVFEGQSWCDTLMVHSDSVRIVRTEM